MTRQNRQTLGVQFVIGVLLITLGAYAWLGLRGVASVGLLLGVAVLVRAAATIAARHERGERGVDW